MKKLLFAISTLAAMMAVSCSKTDVVAENTTEAEVYEVKIGMGGAITSEIGPLTKAGDARKIVVINVYSSPIEQNNYSHSAVGIFDSQDISITLSSANKYKFEVASYDFNKTGGVYFLMKGGHGLTIKETDIDNTFHFESTWSVSMGDIAVEGEFFYGSTTDYIPQKNGSVSIEMHRASFGLNVVINNLAEGSVSLQFTKKSRSYKFTLSDLVSNYYGLWPMIRLAGDYPVANGSFTMDLTATLKKSEEVTIPLGSATITFTQNKKTTITIDASVPTSENGLSLNYSTDDMTDSEDNYSIGGGESQETPIN